ncbi:MAG: hypothetical protein INF75_00755 [Roseomonas sp.]|nr:hypothetical protein [Roseomonas sp.]MCA3330789.1 hypothetical protein [Roseomonas sp.]MCA3334278.1 hypothetical protein [Roseomonas sp.]MCA3347324.1 hypothetical protein [Roseomonas sp.]MCA3354615.1 hypothetical protein [Roseomonas sp.]
MNPAGAVGAGVVWPQSRHLRIAPIGAGLQGVREFVMVPSGLKSPFSARSFSVQQRGARKKSATGE